MEEKHEAVPVRELIKNVMRDTYATAPTDKYGQISRFSLQVYTLFKERTEEVADFVKQDRSLVTISTFASRAGHIVAIDSIEDPTLRKECSDLLDKNPSYLRSNRW